VALCPAVHAAQDAVPAPERLSSPAARFVDYLASRRDLSPDVSRLLRETWSACTDCDEDEFLTQGLALIAPEFRAGLEAYEAGAFDRVHEIMGGLRNDANDFIAVNAAAYEIKALAELERPREGLERLDTLLANDAAGVAAHSYFRTEAEFLRGYFLLLDLRFDDAEAALRRFLDGHPVASERLRLTARQMLAEIAARREGGLGEVTDLMGFAHRRLQAGDSGTEVQQRQQRAVELLDTLIAEAESQEQSGGGSGSESQPDRRPGSAPRSPMPDSRLPPGSFRGEGSLREARRANPGEMWGAMPPAERERVLQVLRERFPARYRRLVEQYYEELARKP
jgi:hypothetical protein